MNKYITFAAKVAVLTSELSKGKRLKVGAVLLSDNRIIASGYNGLPRGFTPDSLEDENNITLPNVIHAELNCILNAAYHGISTKDTTLVITHSPCRHCAALIAQAGITQVYYITQYKDDTGIKELEKYNVQVTHINDAINAITLQSDNN